MGHDRNNIVAVAMVMSLAVTFLLEMFTASYILTSKNSVSLILS
jgi:hypothetical protein